MSIPTGMGDKKPPKPAAEHLSRRHWQRAVLESLIEGGIAAVTVPRIAKRLSVTKGSFYWHFRSIDDLLQAALEDWERIFTDERLAKFAAITDPEKRFEPWLTELERDHSAQKLHLAIASAADHPVIGAIFARVAAKRIKFIARSLREIGFSPRDANARAIAVHAAYLGFLRMAHHGPEIVGAGPTRARNVRIMFEALSNKASG